MTLPEVPAYTYTRRYQRTFRLCMLAAAAAVALAVDLRTQDWRFELIDHRLRLADSRSLKLETRIEDVNRRIWKHRPSHLSVATSHGLIQELRKIVQDLQQEGERAS